MQVKTLDNKSYIKTDSKVVDYYVNGLGALTIKFEDGTEFIIYSE